jgi:hypothetical protein
MLAAPAPDWPHSVRKPAMFRIHALPADTFAPPFALADDAHATGA